MEFVDYKCLESLLIEGQNMIATEAASHDSTLEKIYNKIGKSRIIPKDDKSYIYLSELIETCKYPEKLTQNDIMCLHNYYYDEQYSLDYFAPSEEPEDIAIVKKNKPVPIYSFGNGDFFCITASGAIKEYIHDSKNLFDSPYAKNFKNYTDWYKKYILKDGTTATEATVDSSIMMDDEIYSKIYYKVKHAIPNKYKIIYVNVKCNDNGNKHNYDVNITVRENANNTPVDLSSLNIVPMSKLIQIYTEICNIVNPARSKLSNVNKWESMIVKYENDSFSTSFKYAD